MDIVLFQTVVADFFNTFVGFLMKRLGGFLGTLFHGLFKSESISEGFIFLKNSLNIRSSLPLNSVAGRGKKVELKDENLNELFDALSSNYETRGYEKAARSAMIK